MRLKLSPYFKNHSADLGPVLADTCFWSWTVEAETSFSLKIVEKYTIYFPTSYIVLVNQGPPMLIYARFRI